MSDQAWTDEDGVAVALLGGDRGGIEVAATAEWWHVAEQCDAGFVISSGEVAGDLCVAKARAIRAAQTYLSASARDCWALLRLEIVDKAEAMDRRHSGCSSQISPGAQVAASMSRGRG